MKKLLNLSLSLVMLCGVLAGCNGSKPAAPETITIWHSAEAPIADTIQKELDKLAPNVMVKLERKENMSDALKLSGNDPNSAPDMYFFAHDKIGTFAEMGLLTPITDFIKPETTADLIPMTIGAGTYKDKAYQMPIYFETLLFMYNKALMKDVPATTDDLLAFMKSYAKDGEYGFIEQHSTAYYLGAWFHAFGGYIIDSSAKPGLNLKATEDAITYHKQFSDMMPADGDWNTVTTLFKEGKAASTINGPWFVPDAKAAGIDLGIAPLPMVSSVNKALSPFSGVQGVSVLKVAEKKKAAITAVLEQLAKPDLGIALAKLSGCAPANSKCYDNADVSSNEIVMALKSAAESVTPMPNVPEMDVMWTATENMLVEVNKNGADVAAACEKAQKEAESQIAAMK